jgi:DNA-binding PadR family transcriptional regulator
MFWHVILGLLRDGKQRHGYELVTLYRGRSGTRLGPGNFYRYLSRLGEAGLVETAANPPEADARRIPYRITDRGRQRFDQWLLAPLREDDDLSEWILFLDRVPNDVRDRILERRQEDLWHRNKMLARAREDALAASPAEYNPLPALIARQMKQVSAELDFLEELRAHIAAWERRQAGTQPAKAEMPSAPQARLKRKGATKK